MRRFLLGGKANLCQFATYELAFVSVDLLRSSTGGNVMPKNIHTPIIPNKHDYNVEECLLQAQALNLALWTSSERCA